MSAHHMVDQVAELVEQRDDVAVLHQTGRQVADQRPLGKAHLGHTAHQRELGRMLELALARMQIQVDATHQFPVGGAGHVVGGDRLVPDRYVGACGVAQPEQPPGHGQQPGPHLREVEVGAHHLRIDVEFLAAMHLGVIGGVAGLDPLGVRVVAAQPLQEHRHVAACGRIRGVGDLVDEGRDGLPGADHLHLGVVVRPGRVPQQLSQLGA